MEQYLFRGIKEGTNEFVYGSLLQSEIDVNKLNVKCFICERFMHDAQITTIPVIPSTVGMWSGKEDDNNVKIFQGDLLKTMGAGIKYFEVRIENGEFCIYNNLGYWGSLKRMFEVFPECEHEIEIIGNIHQTPELPNQ